MLYCGVDIGTTNLKVSLVDGEGCARWTRAIPTPRRSAAELSAADGDMVVATAEDLIVEGWRSLGAGRPLAAIATTGVGEDGLYVDDRLRPLTPAIPWFDRSAASEAEKIRMSHAVSARSGIQMEHTRTGARWLWWRSRRPDLQNAAVNWIALTDYPAAVWCGTPFVSETLAARTGCYDILARSWLPAMLEVCGAPHLPPVLGAGQIAGCVVSPRLLKSGAASAATLIVAGGHDHPVASSLIQRINPRARVDSIGTANVVYAEAEVSPPDHLDPDICFTVPVRKTVGTAFLGVYEFSAGVRSLEARGIDMRRFLDLPRMPGLPLNDWTRNDAADVSGDPRRLLEVASLNARLLLEKLTAFGVEEGPIYVTGGWSRSKSLVELRASVFGQALNVLSEQEPAVVGAALLAADGTGVSVDPKATVSVEIVEPNHSWAASYSTAFQH